MHYWRVAPARWATCLRAIHSLGLTIVETYVPWRVHEPTRGELGWTGERDLGRFLDAARAAGLSVVLRPGPPIKAQLTSLGLPDWVLAEPACQARTSRGTPAWMPAPPRAFPIPSYASAVFQRHVRAWYAAVAEIIRPHLAPEGPVVAIGVDNEAQLFFRLGAYDLDYHPDALAWWDEAHDSPPPRVWDPLRGLNARSGCGSRIEYLARALARLRGDARRGRARRHRAVSTTCRRVTTGSTICDGSSRRSAAPSESTRTRRARSFPSSGGGSRPRVSGDARARSREIAFRGRDRVLPVAPAARRHRRSGTRRRDHLLTLLAGGVRGFNIFMAVERDRHYGAAIDREGRVEAHAKWLRPLLLLTLAGDRPGHRCAAPRPRSR